MAADSGVLEAGAVCFGLVVGFITYRTLARTVDKTQVSDLAAIIGAVGGGAVTTLFKPQSDLFAWYAFGLLGGMALFFVLFLFMNGRAELAKVMIAETRVSGGSTGGDPDLSDGQGRPQG
jgi:hypothetical protein